MELLIKIAFILALASLNFAVFIPIFNIKDDALQKAGFMLLAGVNVLMTTIMLFVLHPHMATNLPALAGAGFIGGGVIFAMSVSPFHEGKTS